MELRHLRYFIAVAEELHFGRAAEKLCISQPPLSMQIRQLERELGFVLFDRTNRRVELTAAGRAFLQEARDTLQGLERAAKEGRRIARGQVGWLGVGFVGTATDAVIPPVLSAFRQRYPDVHLVLREAVSARQAQDLRDRRIHVGFARPAIDEEGIVCEVVRREPLVVVLPERHTHAVERRVSLRDLAEEPFVLFPTQPMPSYAQVVIDLCGRAGFQPRVVQDVAEMHTAISLVAAGLGVTIAPDSVRAVRRRGVVYRTLADMSATTELVVAYRAGDRDPVVSAFLDVVREVAGGWSQGNATLGVPPA